MFRCFCVKVYSNGRHNVQYVKDEDLKKYYEFNKISKDRGAGIFVDGECIFKGYLANEMIRNWKKRIKQMMENDSVTKLNKYDIYHVSLKSIFSTEEPLILENIGYIESHEFDKETFWQLCNWSAYSDIKPPNLFADISTCITEVAFYDPDKDLYHVPLGIGWTYYTKIEDVEQYFRDLRFKYTHSLD